jgi:UDP-N-acetylglucosamine 2-epimerase (non-hydrolysing)
MVKIKVAVAVGTRPEVIKMAPVIWEILRRDSLELFFIHTGQHFSSRMFNIFVSDLNLPKPRFSLSAGSGSHALQTARIMVRAERVLLNIRPNIVLVEGDTNSALGVALAAAKLKIPVGHVEAGCRSFDRNMPEELNRTLIADLATLHFAPTRKTYRNLVMEGIPKANIFLTGHPLVDLLNSVMSRVNTSSIIERLKLKNKEFILLTIHRSENVDEQEKLQSILDALSKIAEKVPVIFPIHPRTEKRIRQFGMKEMLSSIICVKPLNYFDILKLIKCSRIVITDSGGIQQEAAILQTPCITLRENTEWMETVEAGVNFLVGTSRSRIISTITQVQNINPAVLRNRFQKIRMVFGRRPVSRKIVNIILKRLPSVAL